jgi:Kef-type K+ transport system membrane component KefB
MVPRGEVGLIFANIGLTLALQGTRVINEGVFAAIVMMVIITTMVTPPLLKWSLERGGTRDLPITSTRQPTSTQGAELPEQVN